MIFKSAISRLKLPLKWVVYSPIARVLLKNSLFYRKFFNVLLAMHHKGAGTLSLYLPIPQQILLIPKMIQSFATWRTRLEREFSLEGKLSDFEDTDKSVRKRTADYYEELKNQFDGRIYFVSLYVALERRIKPEVKNGTDLADVIALIYNSECLWPKLESMRRGTFFPRHIYDQELLRLLDSEAQKGGLSLKTYIEMIVNLKDRLARQKQSYYIEYERSRSSSDQGC